MGKFSFLKPSKASSSAPQPAPAYTATSSFDNSSSVNQPIAGSSNDIYDPYALPDPFRSNITAPPDDGASIHQATPGGSNYSNNLFGLPLPPDALTGSSLPPSPAPVTLTWEQPIAPIADTSSGNFDANGMDEAIDFPPSYEVARVPEHPITYTFSKLGRTSSSGLLLPPADCPDTRPLYYIAASIDFMWPSCVVTSIFKGSNADGDYIGGFTTIQSVYPHGQQAKALSNLQTVTVKTKEMLTDRIFELTRSKTVKGGRAPNLTNIYQYVYRWRYRQPSKALVWTVPHWPQTTDGTIECCRLLHPDVTIATYTTNKRLLFSVTNPVVEPTLMITPEGHKYIDDIVLSVLLLEKERLTFANNA